MKTRTLLAGLALASIAFFSCKKETPEEPVPLKPGQARFTAKNQTFLQDSIWNTALTNFTADTLTYASAWFTPNAPNRIEFMVGISKTVPGGDLTPQEIWDLYAPGEKTFAWLGKQAEGAVVQWHSLESAFPSDYYSSAMGLQTDSHFVITYREELPDDRPFFVAAGTFTCTLYDGGLHAPKKITGEWNGIIPLN